MISVAAAAPAVAVLDSRTFSRVSAFEVLSVTVLPPAENSIRADCGIVRALVEIRRCGMRLRDCRLILQHDGSYRLYGPILKQHIPATEQILCRTLAEWSETEALVMGQRVLEATL